MLPYSENKKLTVINLFGGPGVGKSATAWTLSGMMKKTGMNMEYVPEAAKDYTWEGRHNILTEQDFIFAEQHGRIRRLVGKVDYVVVDSPIILGFMYMPDDFPKSFKAYVMDTFHTYDNVNVLLKRTVPYDPNGRNQTLDEAKEIDVELRQFLVDNNIKFIETDVTQNIAERLFSMVRNIKLFPR